MYPQRSPLGFGWGGYPGFGWGGYPFFGGFGGFGDDDFGQAASLLPFLFVPLISD